MIDFKVGTHFNDDLMAEESFPFVILIKEKELAWNSRAEEQEEKIQILFIDSDDHR